MRNEFFDHFSFYKVLSIRKENVYLSIELFEQYLNEFPNDYMAKAYYASSLVTIGDYEKAQQIIDELLLQRDSDKSYIKNKERVERNNATILYAQIKLLLHTNRYVECYKLLKAFEKTLAKNNYMIKGPVLLCQKKILGQDFRLVYDDSVYLYSQIDDYSEERFIGHIQKHLHNYDGDEITATVFSKDFMLEKVIAAIKESIPSSKALHPGMIEDVYFYKYDSCGKVNNKYTDYFKVVVLHDSNNFITITPTDNGKNYPYIDLNYLQENNLEENINSQIDKFNKKYAKYLIKR